MSRVTVTPYRDASELRQLGEWLYDSELQRQALARIRILRTRGKLPHGAEATGWLVALQLGDDGSTTAAMAYSMALVRFVNGLLDPLQNGVYAASLHVLAKSIHLPVAFVDVRHMATHDDVPPLSLLRTMTRRALEWLWTHYWLVEPKKTPRPHIAPFGEPFSARESIQGLVQANNREALASIVREGKNLQTLAAVVFDMRSEELARALGAAVQLEILAIVIQRCSPYTSASLDERDALHWVLLLLPLVQNAQYPLNMSHYTVESADAVLQSNLSLLPPAHFLHRCFRTPRFVPPTLDDILQAPAPKRAKRAPPPRTAKQQTWVCRPFGTL